MYSPATLFEFWRRLRGVCSDRPRSPKGVTMTKIEQARVMYEVLKLSPATQSLQQFGAFAASGRPEELMDYFRKCLAAHPEKDREIERQGLVSFQRLAGILEKLIDLPTED